MRRICPWILAAAASAAALGCSHIPVNMHTDIRIQHTDGTVEHKETHWQGTLNQLPDQVGKAGKELHATTRELIKVLTDVPPPGHVTLHDLSPNLARFEGKPDSDFVMQAKTKDGKPIRFAYVKLGVPQFDDFFRMAQEMYAMLWQTTQTIGNMRSLASAILKTKVEAGAQLKAEVDRAMGQAQVDTALVAKLRTFNNLAMSLGTLVPELVARAPKLLIAGEELVKSAPTAIANPKVLAHLDLVKTGIVDSGKVIRESAEVLGSFTKDLSGYGAKADLDLSPRTTRSAVLEPTTPSVPRRF